MAKRGPKPGPPRARPRVPLKPDVPSGLAGRAAEIYAEEAAILIDEGYASQLDAPLIVMLSQARALLESLQARREAMTNPLDPEAPKLEDRIEKRIRLVVQLKGQLLGTPRSRSSSRLAADSGRKGEAQPDKLTDFLKRKEPHES